MSMKTVLESIRMCVFTVGVAESVADPRGSTYRIPPPLIINIVNSAKSKKACGYDNIDPYVVQQVIPSSHF